MPTPRLSQQDFERIERNQRYHVNDLLKNYFNILGNSYESLAKNVEIYVNSGSGESGQKERSNEVKKKLIEMFLNPGSRQNLQNAITRIEPYFEGNQSGASGGARTLFRNFRYYNDMMFGAFDHFAEHLGRTHNFFSADMYKMWVQGMRLGLYTACDFCVLGRNGLNYSDGREPSPRLEAVKEYYSLICVVREILATIEQEIGRWGRGGDSYSFTSDDWTEYLRSCREQLNRNFGSERGRQMFNDIFGGPDPNRPEGNWDNIQMRFFTRLAEELLRGREEIPLSNQNRGEGSFNRDYAGEQAEAEARERERRQREERERPDPSQNNENNNIDPDDIPRPEESPRERQRDKSPAREAGEQQARGERPDTPPKFDFGSSTLNDILNNMTDEMEKDGKAAGNNEPFKPSPGLGMPLGTLTKEEAAKMPWLCMAFSLKESLKWFLKDPTTAANFRHGSGDVITLLLELWEVSRRDNFRDVGHNFFWAKNLGTAEKPIKGFARLVKDKEEARTEEEKKKREEGEDKNLLLRGKRKEDIRADQLGWTAWPWRKDKKIPMGVPGVVQKSWRFTRFLRSQHNAYDLKDKSHFIGILYDKYLIQDFQAWSTEIYAPSPAPLSVIWITNQIDFRRDKRDWWGDDPRTINPDNGFSHYIIFSRMRYDKNSTSDENDIYNNFISNKTPTLNSKTLAELVGKIVKEGKGTLVRLGPDLLELKESQNEEQKERSENETPETRKNAADTITEWNLREVGLTPEDFEVLKTAFADPAHIANIIKKLASSISPHKVADLLDKIFNAIHEKTAENMFNQMVDNNPVFSEAEKTQLKKAYQEAKTKSDKRYLWREILSHRAAKETHNKKTEEQKDKIFEEQVNKNPRYGPPGEDTQERRDRFKEYTQANDTKKKKMQEEENTRFTQGENARQWGSYFQDNANREAGAGDESVGTETDNNFNGQFSFMDSLQAINKLKNLSSMKPAGMDEGMKSNKPYWKIVFNHPLTYIFLFIGLIIAIMAAATKKDK
ncbi:MAG: hypothetical protein MRERV_14c045 [Mycoplasmataceae bacterium RV_VA103A]|nr:MAG: hypothetical protein MRERV_14c045 [Mycoplasmataceae bacterium RV_VA103A]